MNYKTEKLCVTISFLKPCAWGFYNLKPFLFVHASLEIQENIYIYFYCLSTAFTIKSGWEMLFQILGWIDDCDTSCI